MKTILVTGGAGFIGSNFVRYWYDNYPDDKIIVLDTLNYAGRLQNISTRIHKDTDRFEFFLGSVLSVEIVNTLVEHADIIVHFAAETHVTRSIYDSRHFFEVDVLGTHTIANAVLKYCDTVERFIHVSTSEVYGTAITRPMTEDHPLNPCSPYASAKSGADRLVYSYFQTYGIPAVILRPFNQYGPYQHLEKVIPRFITSALRDIPLTVHGNGDAMRDWLHVDDTCARIAAAIKAPVNKVAGEAINLGSGEVISVIDIAKIILQELGKTEDLLTYIGDRPGQVDIHHSSTEKAEKLLDIKPGRTFQQGIRETIKWYSENEDWWQEIEWMKQIRILTKRGKMEKH